MQHLNLFADDHFHAAVRELGILLHELRGLGMELSPSKLLLRSRAHGRPSCAKGISKSKTMAKLSLL